MATDYGLDYEQVKKLSAGLKEGADAVTSVATVLGPKVSGLKWTGPDATFFKKNWEGYAKNLKAIAAALNEVAAEASKQAEQQKEIST